VIKLGLDTIREAHRKVIRETAFALEAEGTAAGQFAKFYVRAHPTFKPHTGNLQDKTDYRVGRVAGGRIVRIFNTAKYAPYIEYGTRDHGPVTASHLRFKVGGRWVTTKKVRGIKARKFLYNAATAAGRVLEQGLEKRMKRIGAEFSR
jgi:hypothetical protein